MIYNKEMPPEPGTVTGGISKTNQLNLNLYLNFKAHEGVKTSQA